MTRQLLGVLHLRPTPSARGTPFERLLEAALTDARALAAGGVDGVIVENFGDAPFHKGTREDPVPPDVPAALAVTAREVRMATGLPVGINCLRNDGVAAIGAAVVAGATWVRINVLAGSFVTDQGRIDGEAARVRAYARLVGAEVTILADLLVKHAIPRSPISARVAAKDLQQRSGADGILLTGTRTGEPVDPSLLAEVRDAVGDFPVWIGSGLCEENAPALWPLCDGAIVGTAFERDGESGAPVEVERVRRLRAVLEGLEGNAASGSSPSQG